MNTVENPYPRKIRGKTQGVPSIPKSRGHVRLWTHGVTTCGWTTKGGVCWPSVYCACITAVASCKWSIYSHSDELNTAHITSVGYTVHTCLVAQTCRCISMHCRLYHHGYRPTLLHCPHAPVNSCGPLDSLCSQTSLNLHCVRKNIHLFIFQITLSKTERF